MLDDGTHTVNAQVRLKNGQSLTRTATFTVSNGENRKRLFYSSRINRTNPLSLDGARISTSTTFVFISPIKVIEGASIRFMLDGSAVSPELNSPYDLVERSGTVLQTDSTFLGACTYSKRLLFCLKELRFPSIRRPSHVTPHSALRRLPRVFESSNHEQHRRFTDNPTALRVPCGSQTKP